MAKMNVDQLCLDASDRICRMEALLKKAEARRDKRMKTALRKSLVEMWEHRNSHSDDYGVIFDNFPADREDAYYYGSLADRLSDSTVICTARDDWGHTPLDEYESGEEFADMAMAVFSDDLLRIGYGFIRPVGR